MRHDRLQRFGRKRLADVVDDVGRLGESRLQVLTLRAGARHHHDGDARKLGLGGQPTADLDRVTVGDEGVEKDEVGKGMPLSHQGHGVVVVGRSGYRVPRLGQRELNDL